MTAAIKFYNKHSKIALIDLAKTIEESEENREPPESDSIYELKPAARKTLQAIRQAIAWHIEDERNRSGNPVPVCGYSGRKTNRR